MAYLAPIWLCLAVLLALGVCAWGQAPAGVPMSEGAPQTWRYVTQTPPEGWNARGFNDSAWKTGQAPFGAHMFGIKTPWTDTPGDIWLRRAFVLRRPMVYPLVNVQCDDSAEVYVDGVLAATVPSPQVTSVPVPDAVRALLTLGPHVLAVHCHQIGGGQIIDAGLSDLGVSPLALPQTPPRDVESDTWTATDGLGRSLVGARQAGPPRKGKYVAMFYFLANHEPHMPLFDVTKLLAADPQNPKYGICPNWWSQPALGYYQSDDEAVIRKHMQMLAEAGVDTIVCDNTNGPTYPDVYLHVCKVMEEMRAEGDRTPQIAFFAGHGAWDTLYRDFYSKGLFENLWFRWQGKPLLMVHVDPTDHLSPDITNFFTIRESWAWTSSWGPTGWFGDGHDKWPWLDNYPQNFGWDKNPQTPEEMAVEVAQHASTSIGRSSLSQHEPPVNDYRVTPNTPQGLCFAQQFQRALQVSPELIFVTGWNEWTAGCYQEGSDTTMAGKPAPKGSALFVDEYNEEFSRDIEPEDGLLQDDYYYQLVNFIRQYKGARTLPPVMPKTIAMTGSFAQWNGVAPEFRAEAGVGMQRDHSEYGGNGRYVNNTGRNAVVAAKVAYDAQNVYFYARASAKITAPAGNDWMLLLINTHAPAKPGWLGYDFVVNRSPTVQTTSVERNVGGGFEWASVGRVSYRMLGNQIMVTIPRRLLGLNKIPTAIDFKWADNCLSAHPQALDFTTNGDAAPEGRFNFHAALEP